MLAMGAVLLVLLLRDVGSGVDGEDLLKEPWWSALISVAIFGGLAAFSLWMGYRVLSARVVLGAERLTATSAFRTVVIPRSDIVEARPQRQTTYFANASLVIERSAADPLKLSLPGWASTEAVRRLEGEINDWAGHAGQ